MGRWWLQKRASPAARPARACGLVTAGGPGPRAWKDIAVIDRTDARRPVADATPFRCGAAKPLISGANDATDATDARIPPEFPPPLRAGGRRDIGVKIEGNLILRSARVARGNPRALARLEGWATQEIVGNALSQHPHCFRRDMAPHPEQAPLLAKGRRLLRPNRDAALRAAPQGEEGSASKDGPLLRVRSLCTLTPMGRRDCAAERASDGCDRKTGGATAPGVPNGFLRSRQPLDSKGCDRKRPHRPQEKTVVLLFGPARHSSVRDEASAPGLGRSEPRALVPGDRLCNHPASVSV